jgi:hypothetical protein
VHSWLVRMGAGEGREMEGRREGNARVKGKEGRPGGLVGGDDTTVLLVGFERLELWVAFVVVL